MRTIQFPQPDGSVITMIQDPKDPFRWTSGTGQTVSQRIVQQFDAGTIKKH
jgi:hypothetical protein